MNFTKYNTSAETALRYDAGLRAFMIQVFNFMAIALAVTGFVAFFAGNSQAYLSMIFTEKGISPLGWVIQLAPLLVVFVFSSQIRSISYSSAQAIFFGFAVLMGLSLAPIFIIYTGESIARTFFIAASTFGAMSIYGYTTKKDLTSFGSFLFMGIIGIFIASLVNLFLQSSGLAFAISLVGVLLFAGLTAYDVQTLKNFYIYAGSASKDQTNKIALQGSLSLYLDFINLFIYMLRFFGTRRD